MKRIYKYIVLIVAISHFLQLKADETILVRQMEIVKGDTTFLHHFIYNENNQKTIDTKYFKKNNSLIRLNQTEWIYSNGNCVEQRFRKRVNNIWKDVFLISFTYLNGKKNTQININLKNGFEEFVSKTKYIYSQDYLISKIDYQWINNQWEQVQKVNYTYNNENLLQLTTYFIYENGTVSNKQKSEYAYGDNNQLDTITISTFQDNSWSPMQQTIFYYDNISNKKSLEITKQWNNKYNIWQNSQNIEYAYDQNENIINTNYQYWTGLFWQNDVKYQYNYNQSNQLLSKQTYLPIYNDYRLVSEVNYTDFLYGKASLIKSQYKFWGGETNSLVNTFIPFQFNEQNDVRNASEVRLDYTELKDTTVSTYQTKAQNNTISVYPNPSRGIFYFKSDNLEIYHWAVSDMRGRILLENKNPNHSQMIDLTDFNNGIYLLQIDTSEGVKFQKMIKK